jgi:hypothetical protein
MAIKTNTFCAVGYHLPNGSYVTFGGNGAVGPNGALGSDPYPGNFRAQFDATIGDYDGTKAIRILNPCKNSDDFSSAKCQWFDDPSVMSMQAARWYAGAEALADGSIILMGGMSNGGYINRNFPDKDPKTEGGAAQNTWEMWPSNGQSPALVDFLVKTSGLNTYTHMYLLPSGKIFMQANYSTSVCFLVISFTCVNLTLAIWDHTSNTGVDLPDMPGNVIRVYPGSGATAMLPLTPKNNYNPTIIFCGGFSMDADLWGNYSFPFVHTYEMDSSKDCQRITPEPLDGSSPAYEQDDDMLEARTMGQFIILPTGKMLVVNGGSKGTAGYSTTVMAGLSATVSEPNPMGESLADSPALTPALYDPDAAAGSRWSHSNYSAAKYPRLYHSSAILLPDASVMIAGSNPNVDVNLTAKYPTTYAVEIFYPDYFSATTRPQPSGIPSNLSYGGDPFDITVPASSYSGSSNDAADSAIISVVRPGWTTHGMNIGQRFLQLNNTYSVSSDGSIVLHTSQMPPTPEIFQPGPAWVFVTINGIPSNGTYVIVGSGSMGKQPTSAAGALPGSVRADDAKGTADGSATGGSSNSSSSGSSNGNNNSGSTTVQANIVITALAIILPLALWL